MEVFNWFVVKAQALGHKELVYLALLANPKPGDQRLSRTHMRIHGPNLGFNRHAKDIAVLMLGKCYLSCLDW